MNKRSELAAAVVEAAMQQLPELPSISHGSFLVAGDKLGFEEQYDMGRYILRSEQGVFWFPTDKISYSWNMELAEDGKAISIIDIST